MGSSDEMFERGLRDAEQDELNTFYYQHYYHYRQGYDKARRRIRHTPSQSASGERSIRLPLIGIGLIALVAFGVLGYGVWGRSRAETPERSSAQAQETPIVQALTPTRIPRIPTATPEPPTALPPALQVGGRAVIANLNGGPLRVRAGAGVTQKVVARLPEGTEVKLVEGPVDSDGYTWWRVEAGKDSGWVAERSPEGVVWLQPR